MIICHDPDGRITNMMFIYPEEYVDFLTGSGQQFIIVDTALRGETIIAAYYVSKGSLSKRPENPTTIDAGGDAIKLQNVPENSSVVAVLDGVTVPIEGREIEVDEPGSLQLRITSPWPIMEGVYDIQVE